ncbi:MAG: hypothetical protein KC912_23820 [Proteobacteria bacterium]|nr:hypothetical protein [Pseudomonadota bacterium]
MTDTDESKPSGLAQGIAWGSMAGVVLFSITGEALWIAIGTSLGLVFGSAYASSTGKKALDSKQDGVHK